MPRIPLKVRSAVFLCTSNDANLVSIVLEKPTIDKAAAGRFIKHAITQAKAVKISVDSNTTQAGSSTSAVRVPVKMTSKMLERAQYEKELKERDGKSDEEDDLDVIEEDVDMLVDEKMVIVDKSTDSKGKGKQNEVILVEDDDAEAPVGGKRRRPAVDPFAGEFPYQCYIFLPSLTLEYRVRR